MSLRRCVVLALLVIGSTVGFHRPALAAGPTVLTGTLGGAAYKIEVPSGWNGTLVLYSHGYAVPGQTVEAQDVGDPVTGAWLLANGYALAGSAYSRPTGWSVQQALHDQIALLDYFATQFGQPKRTIAWGHSLGGMITAGLIQQYPSRFSAALPMCGVVSGGVAVWNGALDEAFAFKTLLAASSALQVVHITTPVANLTLAEQLLAAAQSTPQGRARLALAAALADVPGWYDPGSPAPTDAATQEQNQALWFQNVLFPFLFAFRAELEARAGGNPSWNTGANYAVQLLGSPDAAEVATLYQQAGLSLMSDLRALNRASRIAADPNAVAYLNSYITYNGQISIPVLTMHTTGDGLVPVQVESSYARVVAEAGNSALLRQVFVSRAGHCTFTPAETIAAFQTLIRRLDTGAWGATDAATMNARASALGPTYNVGSASSGVVPRGPSFVDFRPPAMPRPYEGVSAATSGAMPFAYASGPNGMSGAFVVTFSSSQPGQGEVLFGSGPGCAGLVGVATRDLSAGTTTHMVVVTGNDLPGAGGDMGVQPGMTYWYEVVTAGASGVSVDDNGGHCYTVTVPQTADPIVPLLPPGDISLALASLE